MKKEQTHILVEGALMVALATVLSLFQFNKLPFGGSVTLLSMFPIILFSIRWGLKGGLLASFVYAVLQLMLDIGNVVGWCQTVGILIACILMDYLVPFTLLGLGGLFRKKGFAGWISGTALVILLRFAAHYLSGVYVWKSFGEILGMNIESPYLYSLIYNGAYMVPELIFTLVAAIIFFKIPQTKQVLLREGIPPEKRVC